MPEGAVAGRVGEWCLARPLYRVREFDLAAVPVADRRTALRNLVLAWAPFDVSAYRIGLRGDRGLAWAWDRAKVEDLLRQAGADVQAEVVPEGLLHAAMDADGMRLVTCLEGLEFEVWRDRVTIVSRWWPQLPDATEWDALRRGAPPALELPGEAPQVAEFAWLARPWLETHAQDDLAGRWTRLEAAAAGAGALVLVALTASQAGALFNVHRLSAARRAEIDRVRSEAGPVLVARDQALGAMAQLQSLAEDLTAPQPVEVLRYLARVLPPKGVILREFELNGTVLRLGLALDPEVQRSTVVKDLQSGGWLSGVRELGDAPGRGWVNFEMQLDAPSPPLGGMRNANATAGDARSVR